MNLFNHVEFKGHERVAFYQDSRTGLRAIVAIHNRQLGPAIGGCRMYPYKSDGDALTDVLRLSYGMSLKCALADIPYGGGKAVIIGDPVRAKTPALLSAMASFVDSFHGDYITSFDSGTTLADIQAMRKVTPHVGGTEAGFENASLSTAYGVFQSIKAAVKHRFRHDNLEGVKIAIQGLGNVGARLAELLKDAGAELYASDIDHANAETICQRLDISAVNSQEITQLEVDVFAPCALGAVINEQFLRESAVPVIVGAANNQLATDTVGDQLLRQERLYVPDFVANAGGIIQLHYQFSGGTRQALMNHLKGIELRVKQILQISEEQARPTSEVATEMAEQVFLGEPTPIRRTA